MKTFRPRGPAADERLGTFLARTTKLPESVVQRMLETGAVTVRFRGKGAWERVRDARLKVNADDEVVAAHDPKVLSLPAFPATPPVWEGPHYGVWGKPAGFMTQGSPSGDHTSLLYAVERAGKKAFPVHRLDRETEGLVLVAYTPKAANALSVLFQEHKIQKTYLAVVCPARPLREEEGTIDAPIDGKAATTRWRLLGPAGEGRLLLELQPLTGRLHQIRRHLVLIGAPVWGDPKYGSNNKNRDGMKLAAVGLSFTDPFDGGPRRFETVASFRP